MHVRVRYSPPPARDAAGTDARSPRTSPGQLGTVLYRGAVPPAKGEWYGIEWDDPSRGRHSGVYEKTGIRYFQTRVEGSGSFLRTDAKSLEVKGKCFIDALLERYLGAPAAAPKATDTEAKAAAPTHKSMPDSAGVASVQRHATSSNFDIEIVLNERVRSHFQDLGKLREVGLEWEDVSRASRSTNDEEEVTAVRELQEFGPKLNSTSEQALSSLVLLQVRYMAPSLPNLVDLQFGYNRLRRLGPHVNDGGDGGRPSLPSIVLPRLERLNLASNELNDWEDLVKELSNLPRLQELILDENRFESLALAQTARVHSATATASHGDRPSVPRRALSQLAKLSLRGTRLSRWASTIDELGAAIPTSFPRLASLRLAHNELVSPRPAADPSDRVPEPLSVSEAHSDAEHNDQAIRREEANRRLLVLARLAQITELDGTPVRAGERIDAERFWLERIRGGGEQEEQALSEWARGRMSELRQAYPDLAPASPAATAAEESRPRTLKSRLIHLRLEPTPELLAAKRTTTPLELSVLPSMRTLVLRAQISRLLGSPLPKTKYRLVAKLQPGEGEKDGVRVEVPTGEEGKELSWWGLQDGDTVQVQPV
ncbi:hypothetical protein JCM8202v2_002704 [Rhodotorula sphaerocarpa]